MVPFYSQSGNGPPEGPAERLRVSSGKRSIAASLFPAEKSQPQNGGCDTLAPERQPVSGQEVSEFT